MKILKTNYITQTILLLTTILFLFSCGEANTKGTPASGYSGSINESKEIGAFEFEVIPYNNNLTMDSGLELEIKNAWVENTWSRQHRIIGHDPIAINSDHQLILKANIVRTPIKRTENFYYFVGDIPLDTFMHYRFDSIGSLEVPIYRETIPHLPSRKERKAFDSLNFKRR